jgi:hypothetical protein
MGNQEWTIQRNWQHRAHKTKTNKTKNNSVCVWHQYAQTNTNNVNQTWPLLQTTGGKDEHRFYVAIVTDITTLNSQRKDTNLYIKSKQFKMEEGCSDGF